MQLVGYILWDTKTDKPLHGTRRFKVWSTQKEALSHTWVGNPDAEVRECYVPDMKQGFEAYREIYGEADRPPQA